MDRHLARAAILLVSASGLGVSHAGETHSNLSVTATVQAIAAFQVQAAPIELAISANDIRRGFIDVEQPVDLLIRSNSEGGFALEVISVDPLLQAMVVRGLGADTPLSGQGGTIIYHWTRPQVVSIELKFHFVLTPSLAPGRYPWPLRLKVQPLQSI